MTSLIQGSFEYSSEKKEAKLTLEQTQVDTKKHVNAFSIELDVEVVEQAGKVHSRVLSFDGAKRLWCVVCSC